MGLSLQTVSPVYSVRDSEREALALTPKDETFQVVAGCPGCALGVEELYPLWLGQSSQVPSTGPITTALFCPEPLLGDLILPVFSPLLSHGLDREQTETTPDFWAQPPPLPEDSIPSVASNPDLPLLRGRTTCSA